MSFTADHLPRLLHRSAARRRETRLRGLVKTRAVYSTANTSGTWSSSSQIFVMECPRLQSAGGARNSGVRTRRDAHIGFCQVANAFAIGVRKTESHLSSRARRSPGVFPAKITHAPRALPGTTLGLHWAISAPRGGQMGRETLPAVHLRRDVGLRSSNSGGSAANRYGRRHRRLHQGSTPSLEVARIDSCGWMRRARAR